jgi:hypothetical protein
VHVNTASKEEKDNFKKRLLKYLWITHPAAAAAAAAAARNRLCHGITRRILLLL